MHDLISRKAALDALDKIFPADPMRNDYTQGITCGAALATEYIKQLPTAQPEPHYCRECKWSKCHTYADKHGKIETYWRCLNWHGETDEEGYCHEWERRTDEQDDRC